MTLLAQETEYWFAGILTVVAAVIVTAVILASSRSRDDENDS
jgi:L-asparagine transporter-like permease